MFTDRQKKTILKALDNGYLSGLDDLDIVTLRELKAFVENKAPTYNEANILTKSVIYLAYQGGAGRSIFDSVEIEQNKKDEHIKQIKKILSLYANT